MPYKAILILFLITGMSGAQRDPMHSANTFSRGIESDKAFAEKWLKASSAGIMEKANKETYAMKEHPKEDHPGENQNTSPKAPESCRLASEACSEAIREQKHLFRTGLIISLIYWGDDL